MAELPIPTGYGVPLVNQTTKRLPDATMAAIRADVADILPEAPEPTVPGTPVLAFVDVLTGQEARPAALHTHWIDTRSPVTIADRPVSMTAADLWYHVPFAATTPPDEEEPEEPEEPTDPGTTPTSYLSVFGAVSPGSNAASHSDGGGSLIVGDRFYSTKALRIRGARLWNPAGSDGTFLTRPVQFSAWAEDWTNEALTSDIPAGAPTATKTHTAQRVAGTWTEVLFDTPIVINPVSSAANGPDCITIAVRMDGTHYVTTALGASGSGNEDAVRSTMDSGTYLAEMTFRRAVANVSIQPYAYYGVDILFEVV